MDKQGILNLRTLLSNARTVATFVNPVLDYESKLLSTMTRMKTSRTMTERIGARWRIDLIELALILCAHYEDDEVDGV